VLALFKVLMEVFRSLKTPVVVAFDQLEDLLLARRSDDAHKTAESFFAGIVQVMHQIDGLCFLIFAERGLWNRFVPSLDGYIQDRLNNPVHVPKQGTVKAIRLEAPSADLFRRVAEARLRPCLDELPGGDPVPEIFPFADEQVTRIARTEPTLRDMLQQCRHLFDHLVYGPDDAAGVRGPESGVRSQPEEPAVESRESAQANPERERRGETEDAPATPPESRVSSLIPDSCPPTLEPTPAPEMTSRVAALLGHDEPESPTITFKQIDIVEAPAAEAEVPMATPVMEEEPAVGSGQWTEAEPAPMSSDVSDAVNSGDPANSPAIEGPPAPAFNPPTAVAPPPLPSIKELWEQEQRAARRKLEPEGALTGATRELQAGLGSFLAVCHEHGVKVGPWRLQHVVGEFTFGDHPTYGAVTIAHWACKGGQPWKVGLGLFLARGAGKPKDLEVKLAVMDTEPAVVDHLILLRPEDDLTVTGKSKTLLQESERRGKLSRLEPVSLDGFALLYCFPRWLAAVRESLPEGTPLPNLADVIQEKAEKLLEQVCMPVQG
jgi:hypothetical protein